MMLHDITTRLIARNAEVNRPAEPALVLRFCQHFLLSPKDELALLYKEADGFRDHLSQIEVWPLAEIMVKSKPGEQLVFGDVLMNSDLLVRTRRGEVALKYEDTILAVSIGQFVEAIIAGKIDI